MADEAKPVGIPRKIGSVVLLIAGVLVLYALVLSTVLFLLQPAPPQGTPWVLVAAIAGAGILLVRSGAALWARWRLPSAAILLLLSIFTGLRAVWQRSGAVRAAGDLTEWFTRTADAFAATAALLAVIAIALFLMERRRPASADLSVMAAPDEPDDAPASSVESSTTPSGTRSELDGLVRELRSVARAGRSGNAPAGYARTKRIVARIAAFESIGFGDWEEGAITGLLRPETERVPAGVAYVGSGSPRRETPEWLAFSLLRNQAFDCTEFVSAIARRYRRELAWWLLEYATDTDQPADCREHAERYRSELT